MMSRMFVGLIVGMLVSVVAQAGELGLTTVSSFMEWEPDCYEPDPPYVHAYDGDSYNMAVDEFNRYVSDVEDYLYCVEQEGESDLQAVSMAISSGVEDAQNEALDELDSARSDLDMARIMIE